MKGDNFAEPVKGDEEEELDEGDVDALRKIGILTHRRPGMRKGRVRSGALSGGPKKVRTGGDGPGSRGERGRWDERGRERERTGRWERKVRERREQRSEVNGSSGVVSEEKFRTEQKVKRRE